MPQLTNPTQYNQASAGSLQHQVGQAAGTFLTALPGTSTLGNNIINPAVNYHGIPNPGYSAPASPLPGGQAGADTGSYDANGNVLGAYTNQPTAADSAAYNLQKSNLNDLLGRTQTGLDQGLQQLGDSYQSNVNTQQNAENQALQDYADKRVATNQDKLKAYDGINQNANAGYRSLAQLIGRSSGSGSSAFQEALPAVVGQDTSSKRGDANMTYAQNLGNIDTAQKKTEGSFAQILQDLANQRAQQEQSLRTGVENQRQTILGQQQQLQAAQGNTAAAQALQPQIEGSRNSVESFFNQFKPTITAQQAAIAAPDLNQYNVDRSVVNAQQQGVPQGTDPYTAILRKQLQDSSL